MTIRRPEPSRPALRAGATAASVLALLISAPQGGCAEKLHRRAPLSTLPRVTNQGHAWDVVLAGPASAGTPPAYELARRNDDLNHRGGISPAYQDAFAAERRPTLDARSYLYLSRSENRYLYFSRPPRPPRWIEP